VIYNDAYYYLLTMNKVQDVVQIHLPQGAQMGFGADNGVQVVGGGIGNQSAAEASVAAIKAQQEEQRKKRVHLSAIETGPMGDRVETGPMGKRKKERKKALYTGCTVSL
jgi:hypothetical protein